jgi:hypothetical protein
MVTNATKLVGVLSRTLAGEFTMNSEYNEHLAILGENQNSFVQEHASEIKAFERIFANFTSIRGIVKIGKDADNRPHVGLWPFVTLMQRQATIAFDSLVKCQSYMAWVTLRPCIEAALIVGKWVDDPNNAKIWTDRTSKPTLYRNTYEGVKLRSKSLPNSDRIQTVLKLTNDDFMHTNMRYFLRHASRTSMPTGEWFEIQFFDSGNEHQVHLYAILHLLFFIQDALLSMLTTLFTTVTMADVGLVEFETEFGATVNNWLRERPDDLRAIISERGLWIV